VDFQPVREAGCRLDPAGDYRQVRAADFQQVLAAAVRPGQPADFDDYAAVRLRRWLRTTHKLRRGRRMHREPKNATAQPSAAKASPRKMTPAQIARAQKLAREWKPKPPN
jgi:hypothetical protein